MTWNTPLTWQVDQLVTEADLNSQVRDNLRFLKDPPTALVRLDEEQDFASTSDEFVDIDRQKLALNVTTAGGDLLVAFYGMLRNSTTSGGAAIDVALDGVRIGGDDGLLVTDPDLRDWFPVCFLVLLRELAAGPHNLFLQWRRTGPVGTLYLAAGASTSDVATHSQFWAREVS